MIATGRPFSALPKDVFEIDAIRYVLTSNGASITDLRKNETFYENCLSPLAVEHAVELLRKHDYIIECFIHGTAYIEKWYYEQVRETHESFKSVSYILETRNPIDGIYDFMQHNREHIENINVNFEDVSQKPAMKEKLLMLPEVTITSSFPHKARALSEMGRLLGIRADEMMAAGDSPNDIAMLNAVGMPVAVGNAEEEVKAVAKYIAPPNHEDGVAEAIERFVLV